MVPGKDGVKRDVVLGFDNVDDYKNISSDFGACIGRYANRINQGKITVEGVEYQLPQNNFGHCLHGGPEGWQYKIFDVEQVTDNKLTLVLNSPDGDANFPGNVVAKVTYTLTDNAKRISRISPGNVDAADSGHPFAEVWDFAEVIFTNVSNLVMLGNHFQSSQGICIGLVICNIYYRT